MIELIDTNSSAIAAEFVRARRSAGSPAMGMIMTLVIVVEGVDADEAMKVARSASREHPARIIGVVYGDRRGAAQVDAQVGIGSDASGERAIITLTGEVTRHPAVRRPPAAAAGLPRRGVVARQVPRRPGSRPARPRSAPAGSPTPSASRAARPRRCSTQCTSYAPGNTDLAWTRITGWRALLAAALDQHPGKVLSAAVSAERVSPSADLLCAWLGDRLRCEVVADQLQGPRHHRRPC